MKIRFESWYENNSINKETLSLFDEGIMCYRVGAYRAAFIMTYLGLQIAIKNRILSATYKPNHMPKSKWNDIINRLQDDRMWDYEVFNVVNMKQPDSVFVIGDDIRKQYEYWRNIRNDCAHAKSNIIDYPHVEAFWLFIQANYDKFVVNGGRQGLMEKIKKHYDIRYTSPYAKVSYIVEAIKSCVNTNEIVDFLEDIYLFFSEDLKLWNVFSSKHIAHSFWEEIAYSEDIVLRESLYEFVKREKIIFVDFIVEYTDKFYEFILDDRFIRIFWNDWIWDVFNSNNKTGWRCVSTLVGNQIIPEEEQKDFIKMLIYNIKTLPPDDIVDLLMDAGYFDELKLELFNEYIYDVPNGINVLNMNWNRIKYYIITTEVDYDVVKVLNKFYTQTSYGEFHKGMTELFNNNEKLRSQYLEILYNNNMKIPEEFSGFKSV